MAVFRFPIMLCRGLAIGCLLVLLQITAVIAQETTPADNTAAAPLLSQDAALISKSERDLQNIRDVLAKLAKDVTVPSLSIEELDAKRAEAAELRARVFADSQSLETPLKAIRDQLNLLGEKPETSESEDSAIAAQRGQLSETLRQYENLTKQFNLTEGDISRLVARISELQQRNFIRKVFEPNRSILNPLLWLDGLAQTPEFLKRTVSLIALVRAGSSGTESSLDQNRLKIYMIFAVMLAILVYLWLRYARRNGEGLREGDFFRIWQSLRVMLLSALVVAASTVMIALVLDIGDTTDIRLEHLVDALIPSIVSFTLGRAIARGIFRPDAPRIRLIDISDRGARVAYQAITLILAVFSIDMLVDGIAGIIFMPVAFVAAWQAGYAVLQITLIGFFLLGVRSALPVEHEGDDGAPQRYFFGWASYFFHVSWLALAVAAGALIFGYVAFASFLLTNMVQTAGAVALLYLLHHLADAAVNSALDVNSRLGRLLLDRLRLGEKMLSRLCVLFSTLMDFAIVVIGIPLILGLWALTWIDLGSWTSAALAGIRIGDVTVSPSKILLAMGVLVAGIVLARLFAQWLDTRVLARINVDSGVRDSLRTGARYTGFVLAAGFAATSAGLDFSNLTIIAGALGVGIGFGLQSIVNNFVSGLILLAERPIKVGDWIAVSSGEGTVRQINVRSTEIETFDRCSVIIPNSSLISEAVSNWYHDGLSGRIRVAVGVAYNSDPREVEKLLIECAMQHERVLAVPAPYVVFQNFGASSLDFELRAYIDDIGWALTAASDLRFAMFAALKEAGIEIPFPQRDVNLQLKPGEDKALAAVVLPKEAE